MKRGTTITIIIVAAVIVVLGTVYVSWTSKSYSATGQFERLADGSIRYTHSLTNETWHPMRYIVAADPESQVKTVLVHAESSDPDKTVVRMEQGTGNRPWSVALVVPGHQQASIDVTFKLEESVSSPGLSADSNTRGIYPTFEILLNVNK
ncbi:MAG TPA: hypothetical protein GXX23_05740 [Firmicutes bacterium]|nr:hypothetical protein [Candidatus Fermentithermobacillaceae bacterium]